MAARTEACYATVLKRAGENDQGRSLDIALFAAGVNINESKIGSLTAFLRFNGDHVLIVFRSHFQFGDGPSIVTITFQIFRMFLVAEFSMSVAVMLTSVHSSTLPYFLNLSR